MFKKKKKNNIIKLIDNTGNNESQKESSNINKKQDNENNNNDNSLDRNIEKKISRKKILFNNTEKDAVLLLKPAKVLNLTQINLENDNELHNMKPEINSQELSEDKLVKETLIDNCSQDISDENDKPEYINQSFLQQFDENIFDFLKGLDYFDDLENTIKEKLRNLTENT